MTAQVDDPSRSWQPLVDDRREVSALRNLLRLPLCLVVFVAFTVAARLLLWLGRDAAWVRGRWLRAGARLELALLGVSLAVEGAERLDTAGPLILVSNHGSLLDILLFGALLRRPARCLLRREFARIPLLGAVLRGAGHILVDRESPRAAARGIAAAAQALGHGDAVLIFPEGKRHPHGTLGPFRVGVFRLAIRTGVPIVPITVLNAAALLPPGSRAFRPGVVRLVVGAVMDTRNWSLATLDEHVQEVRRAIAQPLARYRAGFKT